MTKISVLPTDSAPTLTDYIPTVDVETGTTKKITLNQLMALMFANFDWSLNMKIAYNTSSPTLSSTSQDLASSGLSLSVTVASACKALVTVGLGIKANSDFEMQPEVRLGGTVQQTIQIAASMDSTNNRGVYRAVQAVVSLPAGTSTLSAGVYLAASTYGMPVGAGFISAIILGKVTA